MTRLRVAAFLLGAALLVTGLGAAYRVTNTIAELDRVERRRDLWQRPAEVLEALELTPSSVVADLGSGAGYFALRVSRAVPKGRVYAVDVRKESLFFLSARALLNGRRNVTTIHGRAEDPLLTAATVDAVLIANTYHEFRDPEAALSEARRVLRPSGRLVIVDHAGAEGRDVSATDVEQDLTRAGFEVQRKQPRFVAAVGQEEWWLVAARRDQRQYQPKEPR